MSLEDRKALDEEMKDNPLWALHRRQMQDVDSAFGDWRFEDLRDEVGVTLIHAIEQRGEFSAPPVMHLDILDTDAKKLFTNLTEDKPDADSIR